MTESKQDARATTTSSPFGKALVVAAFLLFFVQISPAELKAQGAPPGPDSIATEFQNAMRGVAWRAAFSRIHPEGVASFHHLITILVEMDTTRAPLERLYPDRGMDAYRAATQEAVFLRVMEVLSQDAPGLIHALVVREVEVVGSVREEPDLAHVVYRSLADLSGARPELRLMTMKKDGDRWKVLTSQELDILVEAFRGLSRRPLPPPGGILPVSDPDTAQALPIRTSDFTLLPPEDQGGNPDTPAPARPTPPLSR
ncbi:hypothetical protein ACFL3S_08305 [Gemmatimonadota bacterium]